MSSNKIDIEAGEWLARLDRNDASAADLTAFNQWKAMDPRNAAAYARLAATWQALDRIRAMRPSADQPIDNDFLNRVWQQARSESLHYSLPETPQRAIADSQDALQYRFADPAHDSPSYFLRELSLQPVQVSPPHRPRQPSVRRSSWFFPSAAASLLVVLGGLWITNTISGPKTYTTSIGGFQRVVLEDQSAVVLNTDSEVRVRLTPQLRKVELVRGEASFEVTHDASRPFIVSAGKTAIRAVGTKFDVRRVDNSVEVIVDEGKVVVGAPEILEKPLDLVPSTMLRLAAGETALSSGAGVELKTSPKGSVARKLAWQNQMLVFDGDTLADVVAQFNRYNERQLVISDQSLATLQIGGYFRPTNLDAFINVLKSDFSVRIDVEGNRIMLVTATAN